MTHPQPSRQSSTSRSSSYTRESGTSSQSAGMGGGSGGGPPIGPIAGVIGAIGLAYLAIENWGLRIVLLMLLSIILFIAVAWYALSLIGRLPLRATWTVHEKFLQLLRPSPVILIGVLALTNYFPTWVIERAYGPRTFLSFLASAAAVCYLCIYRLTRPGEITTITDHVRPAARYVLSVLGIASAGITSLLVIYLIPAAIAERPQKWWLALVPWRAGTIEGSIAPDDAAVRYAVLGMNLYILTPGAQLDAALDSLCAQQLARVTAAQERLAENSATLAQRRRENRYEAFMDSTRADSLRRVRRGGAAIGARSPGGQPTVDLGPGVPANRPRMPERRGPWDALTKEDSSVDALHIRTMAEQDTAEATEALDTASRMSPDSVFARHSDRKARLTGGTTFTIRNVPKGLRVVAGVSPRGEERIHFWSSVTVPAWKSISVVLLPWRTSGAPLECKDGRSDYPVFDG